MPLFWHLWRATASTTTSALSCTTWLMRSKLTSLLSAVRYDKSVKKDLWIWKEIYEKDVYIWQETYWFSVDAQVHQICVLHYKWELLTTPQIRDLKGHRIWLLCYIWNVTYTSKKIQIYIYISFHTCKVLLASDAWKGLGYGCDIIYEKKLKHKISFLSVSYPYVHGSSGELVGLKGASGIATGWRRLIGSPKLQIIFHKRATKYRSLLRKMTYKDKGSYESSPPCTHDNA